MDNESGSRDGKEGGGRSGRKPDTKLGPRKLREAKRGPGIAKLKAMRIQEDMENKIRNHLGQQSPSAGSGAEGTYGLVINTLV
jgi:hypothetical protein